MGLKTTYYLRTLGASRIEKSTVDMSKFGGTSRADMGVLSGGEIPATVIMQEETITILSQASVPSPIGYNQVQMVPEPAAAMPLSAVEPTPLRDLRNALAQSQSTVARSIVIDSVGIVTNQPEFSLTGHASAPEVIGEVCESCEA